MTVRFDSFVDDDGSPLFECMHASRLRLRPPKTPFRPKLDEKIEGLWNDCWWEGTVCEFDALKGVLFQYDRNVHWTWLPLRCVRPRPPIDDFYPMRRALADRRRDAQQVVICGRQGCTLPSGHAGICQVQVTGKRTLERNRNLIWREEMTMQKRLLSEIQQKRGNRLEATRARAKALLRTEQAGACIRAVKGKETQWHAHFQIDQFSASIREVYVYSEVVITTTHCQSVDQAPDRLGSAGGGSGGASSGGGGSGGGASADRADGEPPMRTLTGMIVLAPGHTLADAHAMLRTELLIWNRPGRSSSLFYISDGVVYPFTEPPNALINPLLPQGSPALLVRQRVLHTSTLRGYT